MISAADKANLFAAILERAADRLGDLNPSLLARFYRRFPEALGAFDRHALGNRAKLETAMVDATLYCVMHWLERSSEVRLIFTDQVPHHCETLQIERDWFAGLVDEMVLLVASTIPGDEPEQQALCADLATDLRHAIEAVPVRQRRQTA